MTRRDLYRLFLPLLLLFQTRALRGQNPDPEKSPSGDGDDMHDSPDVVEKLENELQSKGVGRYRDAPGFNPLIILAIIQAIIMLLQLCWPKGPTQLKHLAKRRPAFVRLAVRREVAEQLRLHHGRLAYSEYDGPAIVTHILDIAANADEKDFIDLHDVATQYLMTKTK